MVPYCFRKYRSPCCCIAFNCAIRFKMESNHGSEKKCDGAESVNFQEALLSMLHSFATQCYGLFYIA